MLEYFAWTMLALVFAVSRLRERGLRAALALVDHLPRLLPVHGPAPPIDWALIGALAATAGSGGLGNLTVTNWVRDKGFGMGATVGAIPSMVGGHEVKLSHVGKVFEANDENLKRWHEWMRYVHFDQVWVWGLFCFLGMYLNVNLATYIVPHRHRPPGPGRRSYQAKYLAERIWPGFWFLTLFNGFWILFKTQLGNTDILVRTVTDCAWMASPRARQWTGGIRAIYYGILIAVLVLGGPRHPVRLSLPAVHHPRQRGRPGPGHRRRPDLVVNRRFLPRAVRAAALARAGPPRLRGLLRVLLVLRDPRPRALAFDLGRPHESPRVRRTRDDGSAEPSRPHRRPGRGPARDLRGGHLRIGHPRLPRPQRAAQARPRDGARDGRDASPRSIRASRAGAWPSACPSTPWSAAGRGPACLEGRQNVCADWKLFGMDRLHGTYAEYVSVPACQLLSLVRVASGARGHPGRSPWPS